MTFFEQYDPRKYQDRYQLLRFVEGSEITKDRDFYILHQSGYLIVYRERVHTYPETCDKAGETRLIADQFEMPLSGIRWFIDVVEQKFFKPPEEGGLPAHKLSYKEVVAGEGLHVMRSAGANPGSSGYDITNSSRRSHLAPRNCQELNLTDTWLFENGLMDYLKELADLYEQGKL